MKQIALVRLAVIALGLLFTLGFAQTAVAQWSNDPNISTPICTYSANIDNYPQVTVMSDDAGDIIAAWHGPNQYASKVFAQRLSFDGKKLWLAEGTTIGQLSGTDQRLLNMVSDRAGGVIVLMEGWFHGFTGNVLQRINSSGVSLWGIEGIHLYEFYGLVGDGSGGAILVGYHGNSDYLLYAHRYNAAGSEVWSTQLVSDNNSYQRGPWGSKIVADGSGGAVIAWLDHRAAGQADIYAQRISASGVVQWAANGVPIAVVPGDQSNLLLTPDGTGGAFIAWKDTRPNQPGVYVQRVNGAGVVQWNMNGINVSSSSTSYWSLRSIVSDGSGGVVVAWSERRPCAGPTDYRDAGSAQRLSSSGTLIWSAGGIDLTGCEGYNPEVIYDGTGGFVSVWEKWNGSFNDVYAQRFNAAGARQWTSTGVPVSTNQFSDVHSTPVLDGRGGVIVPWSLCDANGHAISLYAQRLNLDGTLGAPNLIVNGQFEQSTSNWTMYSAAPNGLSFSTVAGGPSGSYAKVHINATSNNMQVYQTYFPLTARKRYTLGFDAYSPTSRKVFVTVHKHGAPYGSYGFGEWIQLGPNWTHYERQFTAGGFSGTTSDTRLRFYFVYACGAGDDYYFDNVSLAQVLAKAGEEQIAEQPTSFLLEQNFPNPFNPTTEIRYQTSEAGHVTLTVYDVLGREVATLVHGVEEPGYKSVKFDAMDLSSGMYFYKLQSGNFVQTKKMLITK